MNDIQNWLRAFGAALERGDTAAVAAMFADQCYWRDLIAFTWNIVTFESRTEIAEMLQARLADVRPRASSRRARGMVLVRDRAVGRGVGRVQLKDGRCHDADDGADGAERLRGEERHVSASSASSMARFRAARTWTDRRNSDATELGLSRQPYVLIVGGGQGGVALAARLKRLDVPALIVENNPRIPATPGAAATSRSACMIRSGTTICLICRSPITGRSTRRRTRWATGWSPTRRSWS